MGRYNPAFVALLKRVGEKKRLAKLAKSRHKKAHPVVVGTDTLDGAADPRTLGRYFQMKRARLRKEAREDAKERTKGKAEEAPLKPVLIDLPQRGKLDPTPPQMFRPDEHRGQDHYKKLEKVGTKKERRRVKPIIVARASNLTAEGRGSILARGIAEKSLNRAEAEALDVYMGVQGRGSPDLV